MKKFRFIILAFSAISLILSPIADAQTLKTKPSLLKKSVRQKTKEFERRGFSSKGPGTIDFYLIKALNKEVEVDEQGQSKNSLINNSSVDPTYNGAINNCRVAARAALAGNIETRVAELVKQSRNSDEISAKSADAINKTITAGKQLIAQKVSLEDIYVLYREIKDENDGKTLIEVEYSCCYSRRLAMQHAKEVLKQQMINETEELHKDLDKIFDLDS